MKKNFLAVFTLAIAGSVHSKSLLGDISLRASSWQTNIHALKSVTDGVYIPVQPGGKTARIKAGFQNFVNTPIGQSYILIRTFRNSGLVRATLNAQCNTRQVNQTILYFTEYHKYDDMQRPQAVLNL